MLELLGANVASAMNCLWDPRTHTTSLSRLKSLIWKSDYYFLWEINETVLREYEECIRINDVIRGWTLVTYLSGRIGFCCLKFNQIDSYISSHNKFKSRHTIEVMVASWSHGGGRFLFPSCPLDLWLLFSLSHDGCSIFRYCIHTANRKMI